MKLAFPSTREIHAALLAADQRAIEGVNAGYGGPFGAVLQVRYIGPGGKPAAYEFAKSHNRVRSTGFAGAHAEHNAMEEALGNDLKGFLKDHPGSQVVLYSSGESCSNCRAKEEILARHLIDAGLIQPQQFIVYYGATMSDAAELAGFHDEPYLIDFKKPESERAIKVERISLSPNKLPREISEFLNPEFTRDPDVVLLRDDLTIRSPENVNSVLDDKLTAAVRKAGAQQLQNGSATPWDLGGATAYIPVKAGFAVGPRMYATAQWANIGQIVLVESQDNTMNTEAAGGITNSSLFDVVAGSYRHSDAVVTIHARGVRPKLEAQEHWGKLIRTGKLPATAVYNGLQIAK